MKYLYFAIFNQTDKNTIEVTFPDLEPNASTFGHNISEALHMAHDALEGYLLTAEDFGENLPKASDQNDLTVTDNQLLIPIEVDTTLAREREENKSVKKTLTIPKYLNDLGNQNGINFSATLADALKERLGV